MHSKRISMRFGRYEVPGSVDFFEKKNVYVCVSVRLFLTIE